MGRPLRLGEVRGFEYLDIDLGDVEWSTGGPGSNYFGRLTPVEPCVRCGRPVEDLSRTEHGEVLQESILDEETFGGEAICDFCDADAEEVMFEEKVIDLLESKLGLEEKHRDALRSFIETIFTDPAKILQVQDLHSRVGDLEKQNGRLWLGLSIAFGLVAISIAGVVAIALALAS